MKKPALPYTDAKNSLKLKKSFAQTYRVVCYSMIGRMLIGTAYAEVAPNSLPSQARVVTGQISINQHDATMTITQGGQKGIINWESFNIGKDARVEYQQGDAQSVTLNRVVSNDPSQIYGQMTANGQVYLVNPNGVLFAPGSKVDVGGLVVSTENIRDDDFLAGKNQFQREGAQGSIVNQGEIKAHNGGTVALLSPNVSNQGLIVAQQGDVVLAGGDTLTLQAGANGHLQIAVDPATVDSLIENKQLIKADGGQVIMTSTAASALWSSVVSNTGTIEAKEMAGQSGKVTLSADSQHGEVQIGGLIDVSGQRMAGQVQVSGHTVKQTGEIRANSAEAVAGQVKILGTEIQLQANSQIQADGAAGGGVIQIGALKDNPVQEVQADRIELAETASISANAIEKGDGGRITLIANLNNPHSETQIKGSLSAWGGGLGGNGGFIETSAAILGVSSTARVRSSAARGKSGEWLLDPADVTISNTDSNYTNSSNTYTPDTGVSSVTVNASTLTSALDAGTSITITTTNSGTSGSGNGDITVSSAISKTAGNAVTLTLTADRNIYINANISSSLSTMGLTLNAAAGAISGSGNINTNSGTLILNVGSGSGILSGTVTIGALTKSGAGTVTLSGTTTFSSGGSTTINAGTLQISGTWTSGAANAYNGNITNNGTLQYSAAPSTTLNLTGVISGSGKLVKDTASSTLILKGSGDNTYTGATQIDSGTLQLSGSFNPVSATSGISIASGATLLIPSTASYTIAAVISGAGAVNKSSASGTTTFTAKNTYTGLTTVSGGTLVLSGSGSIEDSSGLTLNGTAKFDISGTSSGATVLGLNSASTQTNVVLGSKTLSVNNGSDVSFAGYFSGTGGLIKSGAGKLTLTSTDSAGYWSGTTTIAAGTLSFTQWQALGSATTAGSLLMTGGTLQYSGSLTYDISGRFATSGSQQWNIDTNGIDNTFSSALSGNSSLTKFGSGTLTLTGANTYTGATTVSAGTLKTGLSTATFGNNSSVNVSAGATLDLGGSARPSDHSLVLVQSRTRPLHQSF